MSRPPPGLSGGGEGPWLSAGLHADRPKSLVAGFEAGWRSAPGTIDGVEPATESTHIFLKHTPDAPTP